MRKRANNLTDKELEVMQILWQYGPMFVREMLDHYQEPKPHVNTVSTVVRILEEKGYVGHEPSGNAFRYFAIKAKEQCSKSSFASLVSGFFDNSYKNAVSALVKDEKLSVEDLREIIRMIEEGRKEG